MTINTSNHTTEELLSAALESYCDRHGLERCSADELLMEVEQLHPSDPKAACAPFLRAFIQAWDELASEA